MKLYSISEATIEQVQKRIPIWTQKYFKDDPDSYNIIQTIIDIDPTNGKYSEWLIKRYKQQELPIYDLPQRQQIQQLLTKFDKKKTRLANADINSYTIASLKEALSGELGLTKSERKSARRGRLQVPPGAEVLHEDDDFYLVKITTPEAAMSLSSGTKWCTANETHAKSHLRKGPLYLIYENGQRAYLLHYPTSQLKDINNLNVDVIGDQGIIDNTQRLLDLVEPYTGKSIYSMPSKALDILFTKFNKVNLISLQGATPDNIGAIKQIREAILENVQVLETYLAIRGRKDLSQAGMDRWPEAENAVMHTRGMITYAQHILKARWPEAEKAILNKNVKSLLGVDAYNEAQFLAYVYAEKFFPNVGWPEAEPLIAPNTYLSYKYAKDVIHKRFPLGEASMIESCLYESTDIKDSVFWNYLTEVVKGPIPEFIDAIEAKYQKADESGETASKFDIFFTQRNDQYKAELRSKATKYAELMSVVFNVPRKSGDTGQVSPWKSFYIDETDRVWEVVQLPSGDTRYRSLIDSVSSRPKINPDTYTKLQQIGRKARSQIFSPQNAISQEPWTER